jgi:hypothetical protein
MEQRLIPHKLRSGKTLIRSHLCQSLDPRVRGDEREGWYSNKFFHRLGSGKQVLHRMHEELDPRFRGDERGRDRFVLIHLTNPASR